MFSSIISKKLNLSSTNVSSVIGLLEEGATVPFIARYRKDKTGGLEDVSIFEIQKELNRCKELEKRKKHILSTIEEQGKLTDLLKQKIDECWEEKALEDLYLPFKPKRKTKAETARQNGLETLAKIIMKQDRQEIHGTASRFVKGDVKSIDEAIGGAQDIIAEWVSEQLGTRDRIRRLYNRTGEFFSKAKKGKDLGKYDQYADFSQKAVKAPSHRVLAILRAADEGLVSSGIKIEKEEAMKIITSYFVKGNGGASDAVNKACQDAYTRLIKPAIENELLKEIKVKADKEAINVFAQNIRQLLMLPPLGSKRILAIDPGFRTGCKVVCLDKNGNLVANTNIYPHPPQKQLKESEDAITKLLSKHQIEAIAIGNGTAGRETESFINSFVDTKSIEVYSINEDGASIYSASEIGREEFPNHDITVRGSVSIGRRLLDPLAELVKIEPKSVGVGQYQHDVDQGLLKTELDHVVESCVNQIGVNINTASKYLLQYIAGVGPTLANNIIKYRTENGDFKSRTELKKVPRLGEKVFEQCAGFLRVKGKNPLDNTSIHPEQYKNVQEIAKSLSVKVDELIGQTIKAEAISRDIEQKIGKLTLQDILNDLAKPAFDPRESVEKVTFDESITSINDLREGMILNGSVTNITNFGAFVNIGIKENGLVHISHITDRFISNPMEELSINQSVRTKVISIDLDKKRIGLSIKEGQ